ncbi:DUF3971 domain-containing protein, partial [Arenicella sp.]|nr:DUF3971 domain-containing protein [Arenicella sp.]
MKLVTKIFLSLLVIYVTVWLIFAAFFSFANNHEQILESYLSRLFERPVSVDRVTTTWIGFSPSFEITGLNVVGDTPQQSALSFRKASAIIDPLSILIFRPLFTQFAIEQPEVEFVNLDNGLLQIAGFQLKSNQSVGFNPRNLISWLLDHHSVTWHAGSIVWRKAYNDIDYFDDISFLYERKSQARSVIATIRLPEGALAFKSQSHGDVINANDWGASLEILGEEGQHYIDPDDLSLTVSDGRGRMLLKSLGVDKIRNFLLLTGIGSAQNWVIQSELSGQLSNAEFNFSGPLLNFQDWSLIADATQVSFNEAENLPSMNNLNGSISASSTGGVFNFSTEAAEFNWQRWFAQPFVINQASGKFEWDLTQSEQININLSDAIFSDQITSISNLNARAEIISGQSRIDNFADLFKINAIQDLSFEAGDVVDENSDKPFSAPIFLDASADFDVPNMALLEQYFPLNPKVAKFREWCRNAIVSGSATDGTISYQGQVSIDALYDGSARLNGQANYDDLVLDYGYQRDWPTLSKAHGILQIENTKLSFFSDQGTLGKDPISRASVSIDSIFRSDRVLDINASIQSVLPTVMNFLFDGP